VAHRDGRDFLIWDTPEEAPHPPNFTPAGGGEVLRQHAPLGWQFYPMRPSRPGASEAGAIIIPGGKPTHHRVRPLDPELPATPIRSGGVREPSTVAHSDRTAGRMVASPDSFRHVALTEIFYSLRSPPRPTPGRIRWRAIRRSQSRPEDHRRVKAAAAPPPFGRPGGRRAGSRHRRRVSRPAQTDRGPGAGSKPRRDIGPCRTKGDRRACWPFPEELDRLTGG